MQTLPSRSSFQICFTILVCLFSRSNSLWRLKIGKVGVDICPVKKICMIVKGLEANSVIAVRIKLLSMYVCNYVYLSICLSISLSILITIYITIDLSVSLFILTIYVSIEFYLLFCVSIQLSVCIYLAVYLYPSIHLPIYFFHSISIRHNSTYWIWSRF